MKTGLWIIAACALYGIILYGYFYYREKKLLKRLQNMVDQAAEGSLTRREISESSLSALENSLKRYLDDSLLAEKNQQKQKELTQELISDISHQTLTPVSNLKLYAELLQEELPGGSETLDTIQEQVDKLDFLIQSLVKLSRMESGIIAVHPVKTAVSRLLETVKAQYGAKAEEKQIGLSVQKTTAQARFDLKWAGEAIGNIVDNAVKYTPAGGIITITVQEYSLFVRIDISDSGIGIEEREIPLIFSRFYRSLSVAEEPGVGIGLYLAREIIQEQKGYIKVSSEKGNGSVFSVFLLM